MTESMRMGVFYKFLRDNGAYEKYFEAMKDQKNTLSYTLDEAIKSDNHLIVMNTFRWSSTADGIFYWSDLYEKWGKKFK